MAKSRIWPARYRFHEFRHDLTAGVTVGIVSLPLAMALAIASGVPPQNGIYTSIVAGILIALAGGSRFNVSGPTAAFVVVLMPIAQEFGLAGLMLAACMAGVILIAMGLARLGTLVHLIPYPVVVGFTSGIGVVIAGLQLPNLLGLQGLEPGGFFLTLWQVLTHLGQIQPGPILVGVATLALLILLPRLDPRIPGPLVAILGGTMLGFLLEQGFHLHLPTLGSEFSYEVNGEIGRGVPHLLPSFALPWKAAGLQNMGWSQLRSLLVAAFSIAALGAIESLLCGVVADGMTGTKHNPNRELIGQGLGNLVAPFFGGIPATGAIARTATNIRAGAISPLAAVWHGVTLLGALLALGPYLAYIPMASLAALLVLVAWNMSEVPHFIRLTRTGPSSDVGVLWACFSLTVMTDMIISVGVGIALAAVLFMKRMAELTGVELVTEGESEESRPLGKSYVAYQIKGPLYFGAAKTALGTLSNISHQVRRIILDFSHVEMIDATGLTSLRSLLTELQNKGIRVDISGVHGRMMPIFERAEIYPAKGEFCFYSSMQEALTHAARDEAHARLSAMESWA